MPALPADAAARRGFPVLRVGENDMASAKIDVAPIEPQRFAGAGPGVEQERDQRAQVIAACLDQPVGLIGRASLGGSQTRGATWLVLADHHATPEGRARADLPANGIN